MDEVLDKTGDGLQTVVLTLQILEHVVKASRGVGVTSLANTLGTTKSRIHRHLQTLVQEGYIIQQEDSERYEVGRSCRKTACLPCSLRLPMRRADRMNHTCLILTP